MNTKLTLTEGGNVTISTPQGDISAERVDLTKINRDEIALKLKRALQILNAAFKRKYGLPLWNNELFASKKFLSGSSLHFFDKSIPSDVFVKYKKFLGDLDTQVDKAQEKNIEDFLDSLKDYRSGYVSFVGYKKSAGQFITLWAFSQPKINIQIDLELVDFNEGRPTEWSQFSHSSDWKDIKEGIKGVFHKYLMRAFTTKTLRDIIILKGKKEVPTKVTSTDLAFSVQQGLRVKIEPVMEGGKHKTIDGLQVYKEIPTKQSTYINDLGIMFEILFGEKPAKVDLEMFNSFIGGLHLAKKYLSSAEQSKLILGFAFTLFGPGAQGLYRGNPELDQKEKMAAFGKMIDTLGASYDKHLVNKMRVDYYKAYKAD